MRLAGHREVAGGCSSVCQEGSSGQLALIARHVIDERCNCGVCWKGAVVPRLKLSVGCEGENEVARLAAGTTGCCVSPLRRVLVGCGDDQCGLRGGALGEVGCLRVCMLDVTC